MSKLSDRSLILILALCFIASTCLNDPQHASAAISWEHSYMPHILPAEPALHVGHIYYRSDGSQHEELSEPHEHHFASERCKVLHAEYVGRHGLSTPAPLRGEHGCAKWANDAAYWRARHHEFRITVKEIHHKYLEREAAFGLTVNPIEELSHV